MNDKKLFYFFLTGWTILNCIQAFCFDISYDEAYYVYYSKDLQWGYFDHPPMVALIVKIGYWLIPNQLGVRLPSVLMSTLSVYLFWKIADFKNVRVFLKVIVSLVALHIMALFAWPEVFLGFFCLLYLYYLKKYLANDKKSYILPLSLLVVAMFLTKYNSIFFPIATIIGAPGLFKRKSFWVIVLLTGLLFIPHIIWQYRSDFISILYHLNERNFGKNYTIWRTINYIITQPLIVGPFIGIFMFILAVKYRSRDSFDRVLKATMYLIYGFFFINTFRGESLKHWNATAIIPVTLLALKELQATPTLLVRYRMLFRFVFVMSLVFFVGVRVLLLDDIIPHTKKIKYERLHNHQSLSKNIQAFANGYPVVFLNDNGAPSHYMFYNNEFSHGLASIMYKRSYFDFTDDYKSLWGKKVLLIGRGDSIMDPGQDFRRAYEFYDNFYTYPGIQFSLEKLKYKINRETRSISIRIKITRNPYTDAELNLVKLNTSYGIITKHEQILVIRNLPIEVKDLAKETGWSTFNIDIPENKEDQLLIRFGIIAGTLPPTNNSSTLVINIR